MGGSWADLMGERWGVRGGIGEIAKIARQPDIEIAK
jgi:hypothetical protein